MLAIVIPYYKLDFFAATLQSLAAQTNQQFKVYIGDDASPQNPAELLKKYEGKFNFTYHRFTKNLGSNSLTQQWERCIALSQNEPWIMLLGDDDVLGNNVVAAFYENLTQFKNKTNVVRFASDMVNHTLKTTSLVFTHPKWEAATTACIRKLTGKTRSSLSEYIFSRKSYKKFGFYNFPLAWYSDDRAWLEFANNKPIYSINGAVVTVGISNQSISGNTANEDVFEQARLQFLEYLVYESLDQFSLTQQAVIFKKYQHFILVNRNVKLFVKLLFFYLKAGKFKQFFIFIAISFMRFLKKLKIIFLLIF